MSPPQSAYAIYFPEGAGYLLVQVLQTVFDSDDFENNVMLVKSLADNRFYHRKTVVLAERSRSGIPSEIEFNPSFSLIPHVKDITKYVDALCGEYYLSICTEVCNGGDLRNLFDVYKKAATGRIPEVLVWKFIADMIKVLNFLDENKIEHKDIVPQNVFIKYLDGDSDDNLPDFLLGNFDQAVRLKDSNRANDLSLFCGCVLYFCRQVSDCNHRPVSDCNDDDSERAFALQIFQERRQLVNLSTDLVECVNQILELGGTDRLTVGFLLNEILPHAERKVRRLRDKVAIKRHGCLTASYKIGDSNPWPDKLEFIPEDWQIVHITRVPDGSGKLAIRGLPRTTPRGKRQQLSFVRCTPGPISLDFVCPFDADRAETIPLFSAHDPNFQAPQEQREAIEEAIEEAQPGQKRKFEQEFNCSPRKKRILCIDSGSDADDVSDGRRGKGYVQALIEGLGLDESDTSASETDTETEIASETETTSEIDTETDTASEPAATLEGVSQRKAAAPERQEKVDDGKLLRRRAFGRLDPGELFLFAALVMITLSVGVRSFDLKPVQVFWSGVGSVLIVVFSLAVQSLFLRHA